MTDFNQVNKHSAPSQLQDIEGKGGKHPMGLYLLFLTEMWERFSFYGMKALLVLYLVSETAGGGLGWSAARAGQLYGIYTGLVYVTMLVGGVLADKYLGFRKAILIGGILMALGHGSLAVEAMPMFYLGLGLLIIGNGFFKPNISSMVGLLYPPGSPLKDSAYTIFYMGINLGAFFGALVCGYLGETYGWHYGFGVAGVGMVLGLLVFYFGQSLLGGVGLKPVKEVKEKIEVKEPLTQVEKQRIYVIFILSFFSILFWLAFEQAGSSLNIFAYRYTNRQLGFIDFEVPATWFQSVNAFFIFMLAPLFSVLWLKLRNVGKNPAGPVKFALGLFFLSLGFLALVIGASAIPQGAETASVSMVWLILAYLLHTIGELCLSPVGLSFVNKLSPVKLVGAMFGVWFLASAIGNYVGGALAGLIEHIAATQSMSAFFMIFVVTAAISGFVLLLLSPVLKKWMHGIK
jgi:proton-dependent oligopeptide transporter, POT family